MHIGSTSGGHAMAAHIAAPRPQSPPVQSADSDGDHDGSSSAAASVSDGSGRGQTLNVKA